MDGPNGFDHQLKVISIASSAHIPSTLTSLSIKNLKVTHNGIFPTTTLFCQGHERAVERHNKFNTSIQPEKKKCWLKNENEKAPPNCRKAEAIYPNDDRVD